MKSMLFWSVVHILEEDGEGNCLKKQTNMMCATKYLTHLKGGSFSEESGGLLDKKSWEDSGVVEWGIWLS